MKRTGLQLGCPLGFTAPTQGADSICDQEGLFMPLSGCANYLEWEALLTAIHAFVMS